MSVYKKLSQARIMLQESALKKSGLNKFAGFQYFELSDFLPTINKINAEVGLCGTVAFDKEIATLTLTDVDDGTSVQFTCPTIEVSLKGCIPVQGLGAMQTYIRRYLWVNAFEITEHDAIDSTSGKELKGVHKPTDNEAFKPAEEEVIFLMSVVDMVVSFKDDYAQAAEYLEAQKLESDEKVWCWSKLDSKIRSGIKNYNQARLAAKMITKEEV